MRRIVAYAAAAVVGVALVAYAPQWLIVGVYAVIAVLGVVATMREGRRRGRGGNSEKPRRVERGPVLTHRADK